jgi:hypothetical protein
MTNKELIELKTSQTVLIVHMHIRESTMCDDINEK